MVDYRTDEKLSKLYLRLWPDAPPPTRKFIPAFYQPIIDQAKRDELDDAELCYDEMIAAKNSFVPVWSNRLTPAEIAECVAEDDAEDEAVWQRFNKASKEYRAAVERNARAEVKSFDADKSFHPDVRYILGLMDLSVSTLSVVEAYDYRTQTEKIDRDVAYVRAADFLGLAYDRHCANLEKQRVERIRNRGAQAKVRHDDSKGRAKRQEIFFGADGRPYVKTGKHSYIVNEDGERERVPLIRYVELDK